MKNSTFFIKFIVGVSLCITLVSAQDEVEPQTVSSEYKHQFMIYGWLPSLSGTMTFEIPEPEPGEDEEVQSSIADKIDMFFMGTYRVERDKYSLMVDAIYLGMSNETELIGNDNTSQPYLDGWLAGVYGGYNLINSQNIRVDLVGGLRYFYLNLGMKVKLINEYSLSKKYNLFDGVIGFDGRVNISKVLFAPYHFDIGTGNSQLTWRASTGVGYGFEWGDVVLTYRYLYYDFRDSKVIKDISFAGPLIGANFRF